MRTWYNRRYFTLDDVKDSLGVLTTFKGPFTMEAAAESVVDFFNDVLKNCGWTEQTFTVSTYMNTCWQQYIWPKFYDQYICFTDDDSIPDDDAEKVFSNYIGPIIAWIRSSDTKFSLLIANQEANKTKLLDQIKSSSINRFNDTPQNAGGFEDLAHNTNVTITESSTDGASLLARLNEVENNLKRLYDDWSNEFRQFIFWSVA